MGSSPTTDSNSFASWLVSRRSLWLFGAIAIAIAGLLVFRLNALSAAKNNLSDKSNTPTVTVTSVSLTSVPTTVSIIGTIGARYDIPIGVEGDGGLVNAIYVEAGDHVKKGQLLARLSTTVLQPQVASLAAALDQSRAEAELAAAEYHRAVAVGAAGALSTEETERRHSTAVTAAAKVKVAEAQLAEAQARVDRAEVRAPAEYPQTRQKTSVGQPMGNEANFSSRAQAGRLRVKIATVG